MVMGEEFELPKRGTSYKDRLKIEVDSELLLLKAKLDRLVKKTTVTQDQIVRLVRGRNKFMWKKKNFFGATKQGSKNPAITKHLKSLINDQLTSLRSTAKKIEVVGLTIRELRNKSV